MIDYFKLAKELTAKAAGKSGGLSYFEAATKSRARGMSYGEVLARSRAGSHTSDPYKAAQTEIQHNIARLQAVGAKPPSLGSRLLSLPAAVFDILDRPAAAVRAAVKAAFTPEKELILGEAWKAFTGKTKVSGEDVLKAAGIAPQNKVARWLASFGTEVLLDPSVYITLGASSLAKKVGQESAEALAKRIVPEIAKETGKNISLESATRLASNALRGEIPVGRLGDAIRRAMGLQVEKVAVPAGLRSLEKTIAAREAESLLGKSYRNVRQIINALQKGIERGKLPESAKGVLQRLTAPEVTREVGRVIGERPRYAIEFGSFMGFTKPIASVDITKTVTGLRNLAEKALGQQGAKVFDWFGRAFVRDYTPLAFKGGERATIQAGKRAIAEAEVMAPSKAKVTLQNVLEKYWKRAGVPQEAREKAVYALEEGLSKEAGRVRVVQNKINRTMQKIVDMAQMDVIPEKEFNAAWKSLEKLRNQLTEAHNAFIARRIRLFGSPEIPKDVQKAADMARKLFANDLKRLTERGVPIKAIDFYVMHLYKDPPEKVREVLRKYAASRGIKAAHPSFMYERLIRDVETAERLGLHPIKDVAVLTAIHQALTDQMLTIDKMGRDLLRIGKDLIRPARMAPPGWHVITDKTIPVLQNMAVHPEVAESLKRLYTIVQNPDEASKVFESVYQKAMRHLKALLTSWNIRFHIVNGTGGVFFNFVDGMSPTAYAKAAKALQDPTKEILINGKRVPAKEILDVFDRFGLPGQGAFRQTQTARSLLQEAVSAANRLGLSTEGAPTLWQRLTAIPREAGETTDTFMRLANFIDQLDKGKTPAEAAAHVKAVHYDYGALTSFEREKLASFLVPFYAWLRFNTPAMLKLMATRPGIFMATQHAVESGKAVHGMKDEEIPDWLKDAMALPIGVDENGNYIFFNPALPLSDLSRLRNPLDVRSVAREVVSTFNPVLTLPFEIVTNQEVFTGRPVSKYPDLPMQRLKDAVTFALTKLGPVREVATARRYATIDTGQLSYKRIPGLGSLFVSVNPQAVQRQRTFELRDVLRQALALQEARGVHVPTWSELKKSRRL